jgi:hypothetical protein
MNNKSTSISEVLKAFHEGRLLREDMLRALVAYPEWRVQIDDSGRPETVPNDDGIMFLVAESGVNQGQVVNGRTLVQDIAPQFGGIVFDPDECWGALFKPERLPELQQWAQIVELEDALSHPAPGQANTLLEGPWWGVVTPGQKQLITYRQQHSEGESRFSLNAVTLLTAPDAVNTFRVTERFRNLEVVELGPELWQDLANRTDYEAICVDPLNPHYRLLPPHLPAALVTGRDVRIGADLLQARTLAEIELWLDLMRARQDKRSHMLHQTSAGVMVVYEAWWNYEPRQLSFVLLESASDSLSLGEGPSQILCAGLLLRFIRGKLAGLPRFRWLANPDQKRRAAAALRGVDALSKLIEDNTIPFSVIRTPEGAQLWHLEPEAFTAKAIAELRQRAEALA